MLIDLHAHSSGISTCCRIPAEKVVEVAKGIGLDGIVLTNHYQKSYIKDGNYLAFAEKYIKEYEYTERCGVSLCLKVFFGIEVTVEKYPKVHLLIYGVDKDFLLKYPDIFDYTQEKLYCVVKENGGSLVQAHPFRNGTSVLDVEFLDGIEVNCHPIYHMSGFENLKVVAKDNGLILTCGGDYHADTYRPHCGTFLPDSIESGRDLSDHLCTTDSIKLRIHEPDTEKPFDYTYFR